MARPTKPGLDYFPLDCTVFTTRPFGSVGAEFGTKGLAICIALQCAIYREGYFVKWGEDLAIAVSRDLWLVNGINLVGEVVGKLVRIGYFDQAIYRDHGVLTSAEIQRAYYEAKQRRVDPSNLPYWVLSIKTPVMSLKTPENEVKTPPNKSRVNKNKIKREGGSKDARARVAPTPEEVGEYFGELGYRGDPERFVAYYAARGWTISGVPMSDWRAAAKAWTRNEDRKPPKIDLTRPCDDFVNLTDEDYAKGWD